MYLVWLNSLIFNEDRFHKSCCLSFCVLMGLLSNQWVMLSYQQCISQRKTMGDLSCTQRPLMSQQLATTQNMVHSPVASAYLGAYQKQYNLAHLRPTESESTFQQMLKRSLLHSRLTFSTLVFFIILNRDSTINNLADSQESLQDHFGRNPKQVMMAY